MCSVLYLRVKRRANFTTGTNLSFIIFLCIAIGCLLIIKSLIAIYRWDAAHAHLVQTSVSDRWLAFSDAGWHSIMRSVELQTILCSPLAILHYTFMLVNTAHYMPSQRITCRVSALHAESAHYMPSQRITCRVSAWIRKCTYFVSQIPRPLSRL